jgi:hypothetical protein
MNKRFVAQILFAVGFLAIGLFAFWLGHRFAEKQNDSRTPAAIPRSFDFSHLAGEPLRTAAVRQILNGTKVVTAGSLYGVELGHFTMRNSGGVSVSACDIYPQITMRFVAGDMAVSGDSPTMIINGDCALADNPAFIEPLMFDYTEIRKTAVQEKSLRQPQAHHSNVEFENVSDTWPREWVLNAVEFVPVNQSDEKIKIEAEEIRKNLGRNVIIAL